MPDDPPIDGAFKIEPSQPLLGAGGGLAAYVALNRRGGDPLMAVRVPDGQSPRAQPLGALARTEIAFCLQPIARGVARDDRGRLAQFVICPAPPGPPLLGADATETEVTREPWTEAELLETLLRPAAAALAALAARHVTHRAIRLNNLFQSARGQPVTLGCAWACGPAALQPSVYEPPYCGACPPSGRDDGHCADDVYALGVVMVALATGAMPMAGLDEAAVVRAKLDLGSAAAILGDARLPPRIADLARGMLAEDPEHRPSPALLADPDAARGRRVAARPRRRAQRPIVVGAYSAWNTRSLAHLLADEPRLAVGMLRTRVIDDWLRRALGDPATAQLLDEAIRAPEGAAAAAAESDLDPVTLMRAVAILDPLAPLCWEGIRLWPDAFGATLAAAAPEHEPSLARLVETEAFAVWAQARPTRVEQAVMVAEARQLRMSLHQPGWIGGIARLRYATNPLLPCRARLLDGAVAVRAADVVGCLEKAADRPDRPALPIDPELAAFLAARIDMRMDADFAAMAKTDAPLATRAMAQLRLLSQLPSSGPAPLLAAWLAAACASTLAGIRGKSRRFQAQAELDRQIASGRLGDIAATLDQASSAEGDQREAQLAEAAMASLQARIAGAHRRLDDDRHASRRLGREIVASIGIMAFAAALVLAVL